MKNLKDYVPCHKITHAANEIVKNPTDETVTAMFHYLTQPDKLFIAQQTIGTKSIAINQIRYAMSDISKVIHA